MDMICPFDSRCPFTAYFGSWNATVRPLCCFVSLTPTFTICYQNCLLTRLWFSWIFMNFWRLFQAILKYPLVKVTMLWYIRYALMCYVTIKPLTTHIKGSWIGFPWTTGGLSIESWPPNPSAAPWSRPRTTESLRSAEKEATTRSSWIIMDQYGSYIMNI